MEHGRRSIGRATGRVHGRRGWRAALGALLLGLAGCAPPDTPPPLRDRVPDAVTDWLEPDTLRSSRLAAGIWHSYLWSPAGPWAIQIVEVDLRRCDLVLRTLQAEGRESGGQGREPVSSMVARAEGAVLAAVNADFFTAEGSALGSEIVAGRVTVARERPGLAWRAGTTPWIGRARVEGDSLRTGWATARQASEGAAAEAASRERQGMVGGFPELLDRGRRVGDLGVAERPGFAGSRHPRTAVGVDPRTGRLWLVLVDGRQSPYSVGMTLPELVRLLEGLGAREALNLDGGGSSALVVGGAVRNRPSDGEERAVVNALAVVRDLSACPR